MSSNNNEKKELKTRRRSAIDLGSMVFGKVPPQAKDLEEAILGAITLEPGAIDVVSEWLKPEMFYVEAHQRIYRGMLALLSRSRPIDILTLSEQLRSTEELEIVGGSYYVTKLQNTVVSSANIETHSKIVLQKFIQREMIRVGGEMIGEAYEDATDIFDLIDNVEQSVYGITNAIHSNRFETTDSLIVKAIQEIEKMRHQPEGKISGVTSGWKSVDTITDGWQNTDLIILAARPAVGKTALALNIARNATREGTPVAFFSLEMSSGQLIRRLMSAESEIPLDKIKKARFDDAEMKQLYTGAVQPLAQAPLMIDDSAGLNIFELRAKARRMKNKFKVGLIIVDYLQLMSGTSESSKRNREQEISEISRGLKKLAKELNVPIIALSQLSRETEKRSSKEPQLSDLRESGAIEQDADAVVFIFRPEYHGFQHDAAGESNPGETILNFAKYRNGSPGKVKLRAKLWIQKFVEMEDDLPFGKNVPAEKDKRGVTTSWLPFKEQVDTDDEVFNPKT